MCLVLKGTNETDEEPRTLSNKQGWPAKQIPIEFVIYFASGYLLSLAVYDDAFACV